MRLFNKIILLFILFTTFLNQSYGQCVPPDIELEAPEKVCYNDEVTLEPNLLNTTSSYGHVWKVNDEEVSNEPTLTISEIKEPLEVLYYAQASNDCASDVYVARQLIISPVSETAEIEVIELDECDPFKLLTFSPPILYTPVVWFKDGEEFVSGNELMELRVFESATYQVLADFDADQCYQLSPEVEVDVLDPGFETLPVTVEENVGSSISITTNLDLFQSITFTSDIGLFPNQLDNTTINDGVITSTFTGIDEQGIYPVKMVATYNEGACKDSIETYIYVGDVDTFQLKLTVKDLVKFTCESPSITPVVSGFELKVFPNNIPLESDENGECMINLPLGEYYIVTAPKELLKEFCGEDTITISVDEKINYQEDVLLKPTDYISTALEDALQVSVKVYPNPFNEYVIIESSKYSGEYVLVNANGEIMVNGKFEQGINTESLKVAPGIYLLKLQSYNGLTAFKKLVKY